MFKFLRKYKGWLLGVFGSLLLIVFLVPQAIQGISQYTATQGGAWARVGADAEKVTFGLLDRLQRELRVVQAVGNPTLQTLGADRSPEHWFLLRREAERAGLHGGAGDGESMLQNMALQINQQRTATDPNAQLLTDADVLGILCQNSGSSPKDVLETLGRLAGVMRLTNLFAGLDRFSDRRLEQAAAEMMLGVSGDVVVLDPLMGPTAATAPTDEEIEAHFAAFAADAVGEGEFGFGYRRPDRFKVEWMSVPAQAIRDAVATGGDLDILTLKRRFAEDPAAFGVTAATSTSRPDFDDYAAQVRAVVLEETTARRLAELSKSISDRFAAGQRSLARTGDGRYLIDETWAERMPALATIAEEISSDYGIPTPEVGSSGEAWLEFNDLSTIPAFGRATTDRFGTAPMRAGDLIRAAKEFAPEEPLPIQVGIAGPVLTAPNGDLVVFRLLAAEPSAPETDLEAVRDQVVEDLRRIVAFRELEADLPRIREQAIQNGLRSVAQAFDTTVEFAPMIREADPQFLQQGFRVTSNLPGGLGRDEELVGQIVREAMQLPIGTAVRELPDADRTFAISDPEKLVAALVRVTDVAPLTREALEPLAANPRFQATLMGSEFGQDLVTMFGLDALSARHQFERVASTASEDEAFDEELDETPAASDVPASS